MSSAADVIATILNAISGVCGPKKSTIQRAEKFVLDNGENIPAILSGLNNICGGIFMSRAGLQLDIPQAHAEFVDTELVAVGRTSPSNLALKKKVGSATLDTTADDLSSGLNEVNTKADLGVSKANTAQSGVNSINSQIGVLNSLTTSIKTSLVGAINEHESQIGNLNLLSTAQRGSLVGAINEVAASSGGGGGSSVYNPIGRIGSYQFLCGSHMWAVVHGSNDLAEMVGAQQKCAVYAASCGTQATTKYFDCMEAIDG